MPCLQLAVLCIGLLLFNQADSVFVYVGSEGTNLYLCSFDEESGDIKRISSMEVEYPSFLALHPSKEYLYTVNEVDHFNNLNDSGGISAYKIDKSNGALQLINSVPSRGGSPAHIALDKTARWVGVANYGSGNYGVWKIQGNFSLASTPTSFIQDAGSGPKPQQDGPHAHEFVFGHENTFVVVPDLGNDMWNQYTFDANTGALEAIQPVRAAAGSGPRHFAFHPSLPYAYGVNEIASTVTVFSSRDSSSSMSIVQIISTLPSAQQSAAAELHFSPDGHKLYVSNRLAHTNGTIATLSINQSNGQLAVIGYTSTQGVQPRFFTLSPSGRFMLVANQFSNNIKVFEISNSTGQIGKLVSSLDGLVQASHILFL